MDIPNQNSITPARMPHFQIPSNVLDDLCSRFLINIPEEEKLDLIRIFFQIEQAHWFYIDFYCTENPGLKTLRIKDFSGQIFKHCPSLRGHAQDVVKIMGNWKSYKMSVPTYGAIMLDPDMKYCLLAQGFSTKASWGFPKGKINAEETPEDCAAREVLEETGFDVKELLKPDEYLENRWQDQLTRLYIIEGVPFSTKFQPRTRKEIKSLQWFAIDALPAYKKDLRSKKQLNMNPNSFFMVIPFVGSLRKWINAHEAQRPKNANSSTYKAKIQKGQEQMGSRSHFKQQQDFTLQNQELLRCKEQVMRGHDENTRSTSPRKANIQQGQEQMGSRSRLKQQQYLTLQNQTKFQELLKCKEQVMRGHDENTRSTSPRKDGYQKAQSDPSLGYSPNPKQEKKQYQILNQNGTLTGKARSLLATQFDECTRAFPGGQEQWMNSFSESFAFCPGAWKDFKFDMEPILACLSSDRRSLL